MLCDFVFVSIFVLKVADFAILKLKMVLVTVISQVKPPC